MADVQARPRIASGTFNRMLTNFRTGPGAGILGFPLWKLVVLQDIVMFGVLGAGLIWYPSTMVNMQAKLAGYVGWPPASWLVKSDTITMLLSVIGCLALGFCLPLLQCLFTNDLSFATSLGVYHLFNSLLMWYCTTVGGASHKVLIPFAMHNFLGGAGLLMTVPGFFDKIMGKVHIA